MVSGFFISKKKSVTTFIKTKENQLLLPYILTSIAMLLVLLIKLTINETEYTQGKSVFMERVLALLYGSGSPYECEAFSVNAAGPVWFLLSLFIGIIIVRVCIDFKWGFIPIIICIIAGYVTSQLVWLPFSVQAGMVDAGYIYVGYLLKTFASKVKEKYDYEIPKSLKIVEIIIEVMVMVGCFLGIYLYIGKYPSDLILLSCNGFPNGIIDVLATFMGAIGVLLFCKLVLDHIPGIKQGLMYIGKNTLLILCIHSVDTIVLDWDFIINRFPGELGKAIVIIYVLKIILYIVFIILWNMIAKLFRKYVVDREKVSS